jgi:hypothetical protein
MTEERPVPTREELVAGLRESGEEFLKVVRAHPVEALEEGRYENGWNARQILAHVAAIEWTYPRLLEIPAAARSAPTGEPPTRAAQGGIDAYNARQVEKREGVPVEELIAEFARNRKATIAAVAAADEALFAQPIRSAGGRTGPLGLVFEEVAVGHVLQHGRDIAGGR